MNTFDAIKKLRDDLENDEEFKKTVEELNEIGTKIYLTSLSIAIAKAIIKSNKENPS